MKKLERMRWNGVMTRPKHKPKRDDMVYQVDHISITKDRTRRMLDPRLEACTAEMRKGVCTAPKLGQVLASGEEQYNMTISMIGSRHNRLRSEMKRRTEEVEEEQEVINEVRVGSVEEVVDVVMGGVGMGIAEMSDLIKGHRMLRHLATRINNPSSTNPSPSNINNRNNNTLDIRIISKPSNKARTRTTHTSNSHTSLSLLL
jgi:hypothetical protein